MSTLGDRVASGTAVIYRHLARQRADPSVEYVLSCARRTIRAKRYCLMVTGDDPPSARVVQPHHTDLDDWVFFVGTDPASRKVEQIGRTGRCQLAFERDTRLACVVVDCAAQVITDPRVAATHFRLEWKAFWPDGPDDDFAAIRCEATRIEVWDGLRRITPEPFGRRSLCLSRVGDDWLREQPEPTR